MAIRELEVSASKQNLTGSDNSHSGRYYWPTIPDIEAWWDDSVEIVLPLPDTGSIESDQSTMDAGALGTYNNHYGYPWSKVPGGFVDISIGVSASGGYIFFTIPSEPGDFVSLIDAVYTYGGVDYHPAITWGSPITLSTLYPLLPVFYDYLGVERDFHDPWDFPKGYVGGGESSTSIAISTLVITYVTSLAVETLPATSITRNSAVLNGSLTNDGGEATDCGFEWGLTDAYGNTTATQSKTTGQVFSQSIAGLNPGSTYHFRAKATNSGGTSYGADATFHVPGYFAWII